MSHLRVVWLCIPSFLMAAFSLFSLSLLAIGLIATSVAAIENSSSSGLERQAIVLTITN
jgi:hypothetical protein